MSEDPQQSLEMVERLRDYEPFGWYLSKQLSELTKMENACLDPKVSPEVREVRFQQYRGAKALFASFEQLLAGLRLGIAQKKKAEDAK